MTGERARPLSGAQGRRIVEQGLREEITRGALAPGQRLVEPELGERYGVTRNSARLALDVLIAAGLVERIPNRGARVRIVATPEVVAILECRQVLDGLLSRRAAQHATDGQVEDLRANLERMRRAVADAELLEYWSLLQEHHRLLAEAAQQPLASSLIERLQGPVVRSRFRLLLAPGRAQESLAEIARVVEAVAGRRADAAESAARANLQGVLDALLRESAGA